MIRTRAAWLTVVVLTSTFAVSMADAATRERSLRIDVVPGHRSVTRRFGAEIIVTDLPGPLFDPLGFVEKWVRYPRLIRSIAETRLTGLGESVRLGRFPERNAPRGSVGIPDRATRPGGP
jgi:hypothetical protein